MHEQVIDKDLIQTALIMAMILKIVVFILGYLTIRLGYNLIRDGVTGKFAFETKLKGFGGALKSTSPGLLFVLLGVMLIGYGIYVKKGVDYDENGGSSTDPKIELPDIGDGDTTTINLERDIETLEEINDESN